MRNNASERRRAIRRSSSKDPVSARLFALLVSLAATLIAASFGLLLIDMSWQALMHGGADRLFFYLGLFYMALGYPVFMAALLLSRHWRRT